MKKFFSRKFLAAAAALVIGVFGASGTAAAAPIVFDFSTIGGVNGDTFTSAVQNGITVASESGLWQKGYNVGNPTPSIFTFDQVSSISIATGGLFKFLSFDLGTGGVSNPTYSFAGYLNNAPVFNSAGGFGGTAFNTILNGDGSIVDRVVITTTLTSTSANIDNIYVDEDVNPVPEPGTMALLATGLVGLYSRRRRRS